VVIFLALYQFRFENAKTLSNLGKKFSSKAKTAIDKRRLQENGELSLKKVFEDFNVKKLFAGFDCENSRFP